MHKELLVAMVVATLVTGCSSASSPGAADTHSPFVAVDSSATSPPAQSPGPGATGSGATATGGACSVMTPADVSSAGIAGQVSEGSVATASSSDPGESECVFNVANKGSNSTLSLDLEPGGKAAYGRLLDRDRPSRSDNVVTSAVAGLGDQAVARTKILPGETTPFSVDVFVLHGDTAFTIGCLAAAATSAQLVALARAIDAKLP